MSNVVDIFLPNFVCFANFLFISNVFINIDGYENKMICILKPLKKWAMSHHQFGIKFCSVVQLEAEI